MKLAFNNATGPIVTAGKEQFATGCEAARLSPRKRIILPLHRQQDAPVQRMMNYLQPRTYIRPHQHPRDGATESLVVLQGGIVFFVFDDNGNITLKFASKADFNPVVDIEPKLWHSFVVTEPDTVLFECKLGPYDSGLDKTFAAWAPAEFSTGADSYLEWLTEQAAQL
jgi:cupin fold WbuC family metalloprotein